MLKRATQLSGSCKNMKFSEYHNLNKGQSNLDFVDIFLNKDIKLFIDPWALKECGNQFCLKCVSHINGFFDLLIERIKNKENSLAEDMLGFCHEVKEIHLGDAQDSYYGLGMGNEQAGDIYKALSESRAIESGSIQDLEDCALMIEGINRDKISDMVANIIKLPLIEYTQEQCLLHEIQTEEINAGYYWDNNKKDWISIRAKLPVIENSGRKEFIILVPKWIVRRDLFLKYSDYFDREILEFEQARHMNAGTALVRVLKDGSLRPPTKKELRKRIEKNKKTVAEFTKDNPALLEKYKERKNKLFEPIDNEEILSLQEDEEYNLNDDVDDKIRELREMMPGSEQAHNYHNLMIGILELIFYPNLSNPIKEYPLADKTKKVDIVFQNSALKGFFMDLSRRSIPSVRIYFECKNFSDDIANEEIDQLAGRLGVNTGKIGFLLSRKIENKERLLIRCKFIKDNQNSYLICLDDEDVINLLELRKNEDRRGISEFLTKRLEELN